MLNCSIGFFCVKFSIHLVEYIAEIVHERSKESIFKTVYAEKILSKQNKKSLQKSIGNLDRNNPQNVEWSPISMSKQEELLYTFY